MDVKKLEKQEAKLRVRVSLKVYIGKICLTLPCQAKIEKRSKRDLYEGSKLLDMQRKQVRLWDSVMESYLRVATSNLMKKSS